MKLPLSWLKEVIDLNIPPHQIAKMLTLAGLEVDACSPLPLGFENIVVGKVTQVTAHPNADKLSLATVTDGVDSYQVVCGAPNCREGMKTAFALVGATLQDKEGKTFEIKTTTIRGVESQGMLCSEKELGLGEDGQGIMEFADRFRLGADVAAIFGDTIFDISLTPNLGHCANVIGVARELSAATGEQVKIPAILVNEEGALRVENEASVTVHNKEKCPRYACRVIKDVAIAPSPEWLQKRLAACGIRPVNNVVDITNYVLMERGHPLHAFDYDCIEGHRIVVRCAEEGEQFVTLDEKQRTLCADDLLICDRSRTVAVAGVMGGLNSEVSERTRHVLLESAYFEPTGIRRTSKRLSLQTEASKRFERGSDPNQVINALNRATMLIQEIAGGKVCSGIIDVKIGDFPERDVSCRLSRINRILGTHLSLSEVENIFQRLDMPYRWDGKNVFTVRIPTYRVDIDSEVDLIEEAARIYGFDNIPKRVAIFSSSTLPHAPIYLFEKEIRSRLIAQNLQEFLTCDLIGPTLLNIVKGSVMPEENVVKVLNPTSIEQSILRTSLLPGLLQAVKFNDDHGCHDVSGFEIGRVHFRKGEQYKEQSVAGVILKGKSRPYHWGSQSRDQDFFDLKGIIEALLSELRIVSYSFTNNKLDFFHPGRQASLYVDSLEMGSLGEVHPAILRRLGVSQKVFFGEIDLHNLFQVRKTDVKMETIPIYPGSIRDLTMTIKEETPIQEVFDSVRSCSSSLLEYCFLLYLFRGEKIQKGYKNATFRFVYRDKNKTIAQKAVDAEHGRITSQIETSIRR
ncbi:MAG: phenylalanine--tRNA ligase subunit beta [Waddliaceae bacterium]